MLSTRLRVLGVGAAGLTLLAAFTAGGPASAAPPSAKPSSSARVVVDPQLLAAERAAARVPASTQSRAALTTLQKRISGYVAQHGTSYTFGSYLDARGVIVLETNAPASVVDRLTAPVQGPRPTVRQTAVTDTFSRNDDIAPFWGGGTLTTSTTKCSTGYAVQTRVAKFMVTNGHCFPNGTTVRNGTGTQIVGTIQGGSSSTVDSALVGGKTYAGRIFIGVVNSSASAPVVSAGSAVVGYSAYCHSGATTGEQCGHTATSTTAQLCTVTGCKSPVIAFTGGVIQQAGDSGAPFYAKDSAGAVYIRGHLIARSSTTGYAQRWDTVATRYGVAIVTG